MPNDYFQFKQFLVQQGGSAMKVSTDACIFGALAARFWKGKPIKNVLDIGTGSGLLSLMLAQEISDILIDGIEIDHSAYLQAKLNFEASPWGPRLSAVSTSFEEYVGSGRKYDAIICNPPFFHHHLNANNAQRNLARHDNSLGKFELAQGVAELLSENGVFCVLYPLSEWLAWVSVADQYGFLLTEQFFIKPRLDVEPNRVVGFYTKDPKFSGRADVLIIYEEDKKTYTSDFQKLLAPYYLNL